MGFYFTITVPKKDLEVQIRKVEYRITNPVLKRSIESDGCLLPGRKALGFVARLFTGSSYDYSSQEIQTIRNLGGMDIYDAVADGIPSRIYVTTNALSVVPKVNDDRDDRNVLEVFMSDVVDTVFLEKQVQSCIDRFDIKGVAQLPAVNDNFVIYTFSVHDSESEDVIDFLRDVGIGAKYNSQLSVIPTALYEGPPASNGLDDYLPSDDEEMDIGMKPAIKKKWTEFKRSIRSKLTVAQVVQYVQNNAKLTFDFFLLVMVAASIAAIGLVDNGVVALFASMLISPLVSPIMALTFGTMIRDPKLTSVGFISEAVGLTLCIVIGFVFGAIVGLPFLNGPWEGVTVWPSVSMTNMGSMKAVAVGTLIAIVAGTGVALSILCGNTAALVGAAISGFILPSAVNAGVFWGLAVATMIGQIRNGDVVVFACSTSSNSTAWRNDDKPYVPQYCQNPVDEFMVEGLVSLFLTLVTIFLIYLSGLAILKIKEVAPYTTRRHLHRFWKEDLQSFRKFISTNVNWRNQLDDEVKQMNPVFMKKLDSDTTYNAVQKRIGPFDRLRTSFMSRTSLLRIPGTNQRANSSSTSSGVSSRPSLIFN